MGNKSEPPACVKDRWWQGRCFCLEKMGLLCSTAAGAEKPGNMSDRSCLLTSSNLSLPSLSPSCPPSPVYSSILLSHNIFLLLSSPPPLQLFKKCSPFCFLLQEFCRRERSQDGWFRQWEKQDWVGSYSVRGFGPRNTSFPLSLHPVEK